MKDAVEKRTGCVLTAGHPVTPQLSQHCAELLTWYIFGDDKKTAYEGLKKPSNGKPSNGKPSNVHFRVAVKISSS